MFIIANEQRMQVKSTMSYTLHMSNVYYEKDKSWQVCGEKGMVVHESVVMCKTVRPYEKQNGTSSEN
jgi:hypothetical protein